MDKGYEISPEVKRTLTQDLSARLIDQINRAMIESLPEPSLTKLNNYIDRVPEIDPLQVQAIIAESNINQKKIALQTMLRFRRLYLGIEEDARA